MAITRIIKCKKCGGTMFYLMFLSVDTLRVVCASPKCGYPPLDLTGRQEIYARLPTQEVHSANQSPIVVAKN